MSKKFELSPLDIQKENEQPLLGCVLLLGRSGFDLIAGMIGPQDFYWPAHSRLFQSMVGLLPADAETLTPWREAVIQSSPNPDMARKYIIALCAEACTFVTIREFAENIRAAAIERQHIAEAA